MPTNPTIPYAPPLPWLKRFTRRLLHALPLLLTAAILLTVAYLISTRLPPRLHLHKLQQDALNARPPAGTPVYIEGPAAAVTPTGYRRVYHPLNCSRHACERLDPSCQSFWQATEYFGLSSVPASTVPHPFDSPLLFHLRRTPEGEDCLVQVLTNPWPVGGSISCSSPFVYPDDWQLHVYLLRPATLLHPPVPLHTSTLTPVEGISLRSHMGLHFTTDDFYPDRLSRPRTLTLYAGQPDPDPTSFHIPFTIADHPGLIRGRLLPAHTVRLTVEWGPQGPPPPFPPN